MRRFLLQSVATWFVLGTATVDAAPLISGFVDGFRNRFQWRVYADNAPDNPFATPSHFTYVYWQQAIGGDIPLYKIELTNSEFNQLGTLAATGIIPLTGAEPNAIGAGSWSWTDFTLTQGQRTSSLYVTSLHPPGQIGALVYNCDPLVCDILATPVIGPVNPPPPLGDYDLNGVVEQEDYDAWKAAFGSSDYAADGNQDGKVDAADYTIWRDNFDGTAALAGTAIPEPATLLSSCAAITVLTLRRKKR